MPRTSPATGLAIAAALLLAAPAEAADSWSSPFSGVKRLHRKTSSQNINALVIDLCHAGVSLQATAYSQRGRTPGSFGALVGAHAVINGDFFSWSSYLTNGLSVSGGAAWPGTKDHGYVAPVAIGDGRVELPHHNNVNAYAAWMKQVVSGHPTLLDNAVHVGNSGDPLCTARHPRTAVGISKDGRTMYWIVVDGRATGRIGMTCAELSAQLKGLGAYDAVNLDGGGSSAMWLKGKGAVNYPSDGSQRVVANHLALHAKGSGAAPHCPLDSYAAVRTGTSLPATMVSGATATAKVAYKNKGAKTWSTSKTRLGTTKPRDRKSVFYTKGSWLGPNRAAAASKAAKPGESAAFSFTLTAPVVCKATSYTERFGLVQEGVIWFADSGGPADGDLEATIKVTPADADGDGSAAGCGDCDDADKAVHPGAQERCNGKDDDCDGTTDEGCEDAGPPGTDAGVDLAGDGVGPLADGMRQSGSEAGQRGRGIDEQVLRGGCAIGVGKHPAGGAWIVLLALLFLARLRRTSR